MPRVAQESRMGHMSTSQKRLRIDIDNEVYEALGKQALGFETPNDVLRRLLGLEPKED